MCLRMSCVCVCVFVWLGGWLAITRLLESHSRAMTSSSRSHYCRTTNELPTSNGVCVHAAELTTHRARSRPSLTPECCPQICRASW